MSCNKKKKKERTIIKVPPQEKVFSVFFVTGSDVRLRLLYNNMFAAKQSGICAARSFLALRAAAKQP